MLHEIQLSRPTLILFCLFICKINFRFYHYDQGSMINLVSWYTFKQFLLDIYLEVEKEMATRSSVLAWRIPGTGEPGGLSSLGSHRVGHDWSDLAAAAEPNQAYRWTLRAQHHKKNRFWISFCRACYLDSINPDYFTLHDLMLNQSTFLFGLIISCFVSCFTLWAIGCLDIWSNIILGVSVRIFLDKSNI